MSESILTTLAQAGSRWDQRTGAISVPVYQTASFSHPELGRSTGYDYSRTANPTGTVLEETLEEIDGGVMRLAIFSGRASIDAVLHLLKPGDHLLVTEDLYGGTHRVLTKLFTQWGLETSFVNMADPDAVEAAEDLLGDLEQAVGKD